MRSVDRPGGRLGLGTGGERALLAFNGVGDGGPVVGTIRPVLASSTDAGATFAARRRGGERTWRRRGATAATNRPGPVEKPGGEEATAVFAATAPPGGAFQPGAELVAALPPLPAPVPTVAAPRQGGTVQVAWHELGVGIRVSRRGP